MQTEYHIEDLVHQTGNLVVYRVTNRDQVSLALVRLKYEDEVLVKFQDGVFEGALEQLMQLNHNCLRSVIDGGLDPVDGFPWIVARWWDGILLPDRVRDFDLTEEECLRIQGHAESLIEALGPVAGTVAFTPGSIVICGDGEQTIDTFSIDYHSWFAAFAEGIHPADLVDVNAKHKALTTYLRRQAGLTSTPLVTAIEAPPTYPENSVALPSAGSSSSLKILPLLAVLLGAIGYFGWKLANREPATRKEPIVLESTPDPVTPSRAAPTPKRVPPVPPVVKEVPELKPTARPKDSAGFASVDPTSPYSLDNKVGKWITFETNLDQTDEKGRLIIPDSAIRAVPPVASEKLLKSAIRNKVTLRGFLASPTVLRIVNPDDIVITYLLQDYYTVDDEPQIRKDFAPVGQIIPVRALVHEVTTSQSGKTLYLQFKPAPPEFTGRVEKSKARSGLDEAYLKSLIGKTIEIKGQARKSSNSSRLSIVLTNKSQIKIIE
jgi:hypothetical protein